VKEASARQIVTRALQSQLAPGVALPGDSTDLEEAGIVDSMGWVEILVSIESQSGLRNFGNSWPEGRLRSIGELTAAILEAAKQGPQEEPSAQAPSSETGTTNVVLAGGACVLGSVRKDIESVEREFNLE